jgi:hypothetical protein
MEEFLKPTPASPDDQVIDAIIIVPPPSPSETNPPLGPAILARVASKAGYHVKTIDLNIRHIRDFSHTESPRQTTAVGDHGKDRRLVAQTSQSIFDMTGLSSRPPLFLPPGADAIAGMHFSFEDLDAALASAALSSSWWSRWIDAEVFSRYLVQPPVLGVSLMGPSQVFAALAIFERTKRIWPSTVTVLGGSHATLLQDRIQQVAHYRRNVDVVLPGHSENELIRLLDGLLPARPVDHQEMPTIRQPANRVLQQGGSFEYLPLFDDEQLKPYDSADLTLPLQFTRGCAYARCTFCTYPIVEPQLTPLDANEAVKTIVHLRRAHGVTRYSIKDSLFTAPMLEALAERLLASPAAGISWSATTKVNRRLITAAPRLAKAGLRTLELGVESIIRETQVLFDKRADVATIEDVILALAEQGITIVVNLIFGAPNEMPSDAHRQLDWFLKLRAHAPNHIDGSLNLLEIVRGSLLEARPPEGVELRGIAPWAYCYSWNAPRWFAEWRSILRDTELR